MIVPLKYLSNFWKTLEMALINCEINFFLTQYASCFIIDVTIANQIPKFTITCTKLYVSVATLSMHDNVELLQQLKPVLKGQLTGININQM